MASELLDVYFGVQPDADRPLTAATLGGLVDLRIDPVSGELNGDPSIGVCDLRPPDASVRTFGGLGIGLGLSAIPARISTTTPIADAPAPGTCGTRPAASDAGVTDP